MIVAGCWLDFAGSNELLIVPAGNLSMMLPQAEASPIENSPNFPGQISCSVVGQRSNRG